MSSCLLRWLAAVTASNFISLCQALSTKVNNENVGAMCEIPSIKFIRSMNTPERHH